MRPFMRIANAIMLILFISWAGFQYNDPDGLLWMAVYGAAGIECILYFMGRLPRFLAISYGGLCVAWAIVLGVVVAINGEFIFEERGREMFGLVICAVWTAILLWLPSHDTQPTVTG